MAEMRPKTEKLKRKEITITENWKKTVVVVVVVVCCCKAVFLCLRSSVAYSDVCGRDDHGQLCAECESALVARLPVRCFVLRGTGEQLQLRHVGGN